MNDEEFTKLLALTLIFPPRKSREGSCRVERA